MRRRMTWWRTSNALSFDSSSSTLKACRRVSILAAAFFQPHLFAKLVRLRAHPRVNDGLMQVQLPGRLRGHDEARAQSGVRRGEGARGPADSCGAQLLLFELGCKPNEAERPIGEARSDGLLTGTSSNGGQDLLC
jgi:hypothetical protein